MLVELRVTALGVIEDQTVLLGPGLTALTGETGAGKTLLVDAISLLTGAPSDPALVAPGAAEARIEGRFEGRLEGCTGGGFEGGSEGDPAGGSEGDPAGGSEVAADTAGAVGGEGEEHILTRVIPAAGRSRGYIDGRMVSLAQLAAVGRALVDIHGQHAHQYLLSPSAQRSALDRAAGIDTAEIDGWRRTVRELTAARAELGGDPRERARQIDLLSYQLSEIDSAGLADPEEDTGLQQEEELLADAAGLVETAGTAWEALAGDGGLVEQLGAVVSATASRRPLAALHAR
ncbi:MAG TPA: AAA family ATPase, partial [Acidimicrobiales bacterium]|nr:AAA family ATPase [Acidimicrobiales bacterium]